MTNDLIKRLREGWIKPLHTPTEFAEAADAIESLRKQLAECELERDAVRLMRDEFGNKWAKAQEQLTTVTKERDELVAALSSIRECVFAAMFEGLQDRLAEEENTDAGSLYDLVMRRLLPMDAYAQAALEKLGADKKGEGS